MSTNTPGSIQAPFLPTSLRFPLDPTELQTTQSKAYIDIAQAVNRRSIGIFNTIQVVTGDQYYSLQNNDIHKPIQFRQSYRMLFVFGPIAAGVTITISHGIAGIVELVNSYGNCITDISVIPNAKYEPIPFVSATDVTQQVEFYMNDTIITIVNGAGNNNILSGTIIVEYLLN